VGGERAAEHGGLYTDEAEQDNTDRLFILVSGENHRGKGGKGKSFYRADGAG